MALLHRDLRQTLCFRAGHGRRFASRTQDDDAVHALALRFRLGLAMGRDAYRAYRELLESDRWQRLASHGAQHRALQGRFPGQRRQHTGKALGDNITGYGNSNPESLDLPLSGAHETWETLFFLHDRTGDLVVRRGVWYDPLGTADWRRQVSAVFARQVHEELA